MILDVVKIKELTTKIKEFERKRNLVKRLDSQIYVPEYREPISRHEHYVDLGAKLDMPSLYLEFLMNEILNKPTESELEIIKDLLLVGKLGRENSQKHYDRQVQNAQDAYKREIENVERMKVQLENSQETYSALEQEVNSPLLPVYDDFITALRTELESVGYNTKLLKDKMKRIVDVIVRQTRWVNYGEETTIAKPVDVQWEGLIAIGPIHKVQILSLVSNVA